MIARVLSLLVVLTLAACTGTAGPSTSSSTADPPGTATASPGVDGTGTTPTADPTGTPAAPTAADDLAAFLAEAQRLDDALRAAAVLITATVGVDVITIDATTADAVAAIDPGTALALVPAGLSPQLVDGVLVVYSDLVARRAAFNRFDRPGEITTEFDDYADARACLGNGSAPAAAFPVDLAALSALAATLPPQVPADPASREAAELAVAGAVVHLGNNGCDSCGGGSVPRAPAITWTVPPGAAAVAEGEVEGISFTATYAPATGWQVLLNAC